MKPHWRRSSASARSPSCATTLPAWSSISPSWSCGGLLEENTIPISHAYPPASLVEDSGQMAVAEPEKVNEFVQKASLLEQNDWLLRTVLMPIKDALISVIAT